MVSVIMITPFNSLRRASRPLALGALSLSISTAILASACQKVPLLAPSGSSITLTSSATTLPINGSTTLIAQILEPAGTPPHTGTHVTFTTTLGTFQPADAETDIGGRAIVTFLAGAASGTATITAISGGAAGSTTTTGSGTGSTTTTGSSNTVKIAIGAAAVGSISIGAEPQIVSSQGGSTTVTASVRDTNGNVLAAVPVTFTTDQGTLSAVVATTDQAGSAHTTLTTGKTAKVTATVGAGGTTGGGTTGGGTATTTTPGSATVTVNVSTAPSITIGALTPAVPAVGQPVSVALTYTTDANSSPIASVRVDFGDRSAPTIYPGRPVSVGHTYNTSGSFLISATVTDALGDTATTTASLTVTPKPQPAVSLTISASPTTGVDVIFTVTVVPPANTVIQDVAIDFDDGRSIHLGPVSGPTAGTTVVAHHVYDLGGTYTVKVTATDSNGGQGNALSTIFVQAAPPLTVLLSVVATPGPGANTTEAFTANVIGLGNAVVVLYSWEFGGSNGTAQTTSPSQTRQYPVGSGPITVRVTITTSTGLHETGTITITP